MRIDKSVEITPTGREEGGIFRIGAVAGIVGALLAMVETSFTLPRPSETRRAWPGRSPKASPGCSFTS